MKTLFSAILMAAFIPYGASQAQAQIGPLQHYDDLAFSAIADARALRWEIHNHFAQSRDRDHLLEDIQDVIADLQALQQSIYQGRSPRALDRDLDRALEGLAALKSHLLVCDYATQRPPFYQGNAKGYVFAPGTVHAGRVHVDHAIEMLTSLERNLDHLHHELLADVSAPAPVHPGPIHPGPGQTLPAPQGPVVFPKVPSSWYGPQLQIQGGKVKFEVHK